MFFAGAIYGKSHYHAGVWYKKKEVDQKVNFFSGDPPGARTQDPNIKSVVLYLLS